VAARSTTHTLRAQVLRRQNELKADQNNNFLKEIDLFQKLRNPYIVNFIGASYVPGKLCLCTELLERGTVLELLQKAKISLALKVSVRVRVTAR
jgi:serine/threonine protein kinase